jgi:soluble lytic murein transglycosylase
MQFIANVLSLFFIFSFANHNVALALEGVKVYTVQIEAKPPALNDIAIQKNAPKLPMAKLKWLQLQGKYLECSKGAATAKNVTAEIKGWYFLLWGSCAGRIKEKTIKLSEVGTWLKVISSAKIAEGPWTSSINELTWNLNWFIVSEMAEKKPALAWKAHLRMLPQLPNKSGEDKEKFYESAGDIAAKLGRKKEAVYFWQQAYGYVESTSLANKIIENGGSAIIKPDAASVDPEEAIIADGVRRLHDKRDWKTLAQRLGEIFKESPSSKLASQWASKLPEMLSQLEKKKESASYDQIVDLMKKSSPLRHEEWARIFHKRGDFKNSLFFGLLAAEKLADSPLAGNLHWLNGRSAHILGQNELALVSLKKAFEIQPTTAEGTESRFRAGLIYLKLQQKPEAINCFRYLISSPSAGKFELSARYWLVRSLSANQDSERQEQLDIIGKKFPFSYYNLKLRAEKLGRFEWPVEFDVKKDKSNKQSVDLFLLANEYEPFKRIEKLATLGWWLEAQAEFSALSESPTGEVQAAWVEQAYKSGAFPFVVKWGSELVDLDAQWTRKEWMSRSYPVAYSPLITKEAEVNKISSTLVKSLIRQESAFGLRAVSTSNAQGLMQMIPPTAREVAQELNIKGLEIPEDMFQPQLNIKMGTYYIAKMLKTFDGHVPLALAGYNAGPHKVSAFLENYPHVQKGSTSFDFSGGDEIWIDELPWSETSFYVKAILRNVILNQLLDKNELKYSPRFWESLAP